MVFYENRWRYISILSALIIVNVLEVIPAQLIGRAIDFISTGEITAMLMWQLIIIFAVVILLSYVGGVPLGVSPHRRGDKD